MALNTESIAKMCNSEGCHFLMSYEQLVICTNIKCYICNNLCKYKNVTLNTESSMKMCDNEGCHFLQIIEKEIVIHMV